MTQLETRFRNTLDSATREKLEIQIRELENAVDELLNRNQQNLRIRRQEIRDFEQQIQQGS